MCGIVGYLGEQQAYPILYKALQKLEYRGYDSAGIAVLDKKNIQVNKAKGKIEELGKHSNLSGKLGIGHTRWATHGKPTDINAHPHTDCTGKFVLVHNGIIENFTTLKKGLIASGHEFKSRTDTEVIAHMLEEYYQGDVLATLAKVVKELKGAYALAVICADSPDKLYVVRQDSSLIVGQNENSIFIGSDIPALLEYTRNVYIMNDGEIGILAVDQIEFYDSNQNLIKKSTHRINWSVEAVEKGGYPHYMLKEIHEQAQAVRNTLQDRLIYKDKELAVALPLDLNIKDFERIYIVAMGTARHAGLVGKQLIQQLAKIPVAVELASEFRYHSALVDEKCLTIIISQSGETADTLAALREAKRLGSVTLAITNVAESTIAREADKVFYTFAGPEIAVASTKAYTTQLICLTLLTIYMAQTKGLTLAPELIKDLQRLPITLEKVLEDIQGPIADLANQLKYEEQIFYIGRGLDYAVMEEGALKLKEISYINAQAFAAGELKHGTLALVAPGIPVVALVTDNNIFDKMISNIEEVKAREAYVIAITNHGVENLQYSSDVVLTLPQVNSFIAPIISVIPLQFLAYYTALARGCDVDKPRNLAKSVTVE